MVAWRRPCSDDEIIEVMENIVANCTLGFFVSGLPSTNAMFKKMKLSCCVVLFLFSVSACYYMVRGEVTPWLIKGQQCFIP